MAFMPLFAMAIAGSTPKEGELVNGIKTDIRVICDGEQFDTFTYGNTVSKALEDTKCPLESSDISNLPADATLDGTPTEIVVTKAMPVVIIDGGKKRVLKSAYRTNEEILKQLNIKVYPEDRVRTELIISDFENDGLGQKITIERAPQITLEADGKSSTSRTLKGTVGDFLTEKGIALAPKDEVSPSRDTKTTDGIKVTVVRINEAETTEDEVIPFTVINKKDYNIFEGQNKVESEGTNGLKKHTYKSRYKNGVLVEKTQIKEEVIRNSITRVVVIGAKPYGHEDLWNIMVRAGAEWGVDPSEIYRVGMCESHLNPSSVGFAEGLMQYKPGTWANATNRYPGGKYAGASIFDPTAQIYVTAWKVSTNGWREWACKP